MTELLEPHAIGTATTRRDGPAKVTGTAPYAFEAPADRPLYCHPVQATIGRGRCSRIATVAAESVDGVVKVITPFTAERLASTDDAELAVLQDHDVPFRGHVVALVLAETPETARHAAELVTVEYDAQPHDVELSADRDDLYAPDSVNPDFPTDTAQGDADAGLARAEVTVEETYTTAMQHNNPLEPHATTALWDNGVLTLWDSTQGVHSVRSTVAEVFGLPPEKVRVRCPTSAAASGRRAGRTRTSCSPHWPPARCRAARSSWR